VAQVKLELGNSKNIDPKLAQYLTSRLDNFAELLRNPPMLPNSRTAA
jgi:hypothetical protein